MSKNSCIEKNPLQHGGTSQEQRFPEALADDYIQIDERSISDLLTFTKSYAQHIKFIDMDGNNTENWEAFFDFDEDKFRKIIILPQLILF